MLSNNIDEITVCVCVFMVAKTKVSFTKVIVSFFPVEKP